MRDQFGLLPHIRENLYGFRANSMQMIPWAIKTFNVEKAWNKSTGKDVIVAVIDTGCDLQHTDLKDNLLPGYNFIDNSNNPQDDNGHGSHVAGTIAAINNSLGVVGISPNTKILPVKSLNHQGTGSSSSVANGIKWAVDHGAGILTMSLGSPDPSRQIEQAIDYAIQHNVAIFCAAGNSGNTTDIQYPAKFAETISIGAIDRNLNVCEFSCCGDTLDFVAPGADIISCMPNNSYGMMTGTSMAAPFAVGCAALYASIHRHKKLKKNDYVDHFRSNTVQLKGKHSGDKRYQGHGIIQPTF